MFSRHGTSPLAHPIDAADAATIDAIYAIQAPLSRSTHELMIIHDYMCLVRPKLVREHYITGFTIVGSVLLNMPYQNHRTEHFDLVSTRIRPPTGLSEVSEHIKVAAFPTFNEHHRRTFISSLTAWVGFLSCVRSPCLLSHLAPLSINSFRYSNNTNFCCKHVGRQSTTSGDATY